MEVIAHYDLLVSLIVRILGKLYANFTRCMQIVSK